MSVEKNLMKCNLADCRYVRILALLAITFTFISIVLYHNIERNYLSNPDGDVYATYAALLTTSGIDFQAQPDPSLFATRVFSWGIQLGHFLGLLELTNIRDIASSDRFDFHFGHALFVGRWLSLLYAAMSIVFFWALSSTVYKNTLISIITTGLYAASIGLGAQANLIESEMPSVMFLLAGLWALVAAMRKREWGALLHLILAGFFIHVAMIMKIQAIFAILPMTILPFFLPWRPSLRFSETDVPYLRAFILGAGVFSAGAVVWMASAVNDEASGFYQAAEAALVIGEVVAFGYAIGATALAIVGSLAALLAGIAGAQYLHLLIDNPASTAIVMNHFDVMFAMKTGPESAGLIDLFLKLPANVVTFVEEYLAPRHFISKHYPFLLIYWATFAGALSLLFARKTRAFFAVSLLLGLSVFLPALFSFRYYSYDYIVYVELWVILGFGLCIAEWSGNVRWRTTALVSGLTVCLIVSGVQARYRLLAPAIAVTRLPDNVCGQIGTAPLIAENLRVHCEAAKKRSGRPVVLIPRSVINNP